MKSYLACAIGAFTRARVALLVVMLFAVPRSADAVSYDDFSLPVGSNPQSVRASDCDGNGVPDILTANYSSMTVTLYTGDGDGFSPARTISMPEAPAGADCGDFNGDGFFDLAVTSFTAGDVTIYRGDASGEFAPSWTYHVGAGTRSLSVTDMDADGHADIVAVNGKSDNLALLYGNGSGTFPSSAILRVQTITQANFPSAATVADLDGNGLPDIVVASHGTPSVNVIVNGDVGYTLLPGALPTTPPARDIAAHDVNGDGLQDLALLSQDARVTLYYGNGSAGFVAGATFPVNADAHAIDLADFNGDALIDVIIAYNKHDNVDIMLALAPGIFPEPDSEPSVVVVNAFGASAPLLSATSDDEVVFVNRSENGLARFGRGTDGTMATRAMAPVADAPQGVLLADVTGDGFADALVVVKARGGAALRLLHGNADGGFDPAPFEGGVCGDGIVTGAELCDDGNNKKRDGCSPTCAPELARSVLSMHAADVDLDGDQDIVIVDSKANVLLLLGDGAGHFPTVRSLARAASRTPVALGDFTGDGAPDIALLPKSRKDGGSLVVLVNDGAGSFTPTSMGATGRLVGPLLAGDLDGDGLLDVLTGVNDKPIGFVAFLNDGTGPRRRTTVTVTPKGLRSLAAADFDEDGRLDVLAEFAKRSPMIFRATAAGEYGAPAALADAFFTPVTVVDIDEDAHQDLVSCDGTSRTCRVLYGTGAGTFDETAPSVVDYIGNGIAAGGVADFDTDGIVDIIGISKTDNRATVLFGPSAGSSQVTRVDLVTGSKPDYLEVADLNLDGRPDIIVVNEGSNDLSVFLNTGGRAFATLVRLVTGGVRPHNVALGDLNGDGRLDAAVPLGASDVVVLFQNRNSGGLTKIATLPTGPSPQSAAMGDLNGDHLADIVTANYESNDLSVFSSDGLGGYVSSTLSNVGIHPTDVVLVDVDEDGDADIVAVSEDTRDLTVFGNDGTGAFAAGVATELEGRSRPWDLCAGDFDGDGHTDVAVGSVGTGDILVLRGLGDGSWSTGERVFPVGKDPRPLVCRDVDGDSRADIVFPNRRTNRVDMILTAGGDWD